MKYFLTFNPFKWDLFISDSADSIKTLYGVYYCFIEIPEEMYLKLCELKQIGAKNGKV